MEIKGFITNLGKYNEGELVCEWITFPINEDELEAVFERIGINQEYEEYFFTDWDYDINPGFGEYVDIAVVNEVAEKLEDADENMVKAIMEATGYGLAEALDVIDSTCFWPGMTLYDLAYEIVDECYELPEIAKTYFDYEAYGRDLGFDGYTETEYGVVRID